ncbi:MAG: hypothetical protein WC760_11020 [Bacteroidia bacterium]|jgi:hypothetical protein
MDNRINDTIKQWMEEWNKRFEEFSLQFNLGKMDAIEAFEKHKDLMRKSVLGWKESLDKLDDLGEDYLKTIKGKLEELLLQLNLGKADTKELFEEQRKKIEQALNELKGSGKTAYNENFDRIMQLFDQSTQTFKTGLEIIQLQYTLGKMEAKDKAADIQAEVVKKMNELNQSFKAAQEIGMEQMEAWKKHMLQGYRQMNIWAEEWLKKMS